MDAPPFVLGAACAVHKGVLVNEHRPEQGIKEGHTVVLTLEQAAVISVKVGACGGAAAALLQHNY